MGEIRELNFRAALSGVPPELARAWGFRSGDRGTHTSRTIMLDELSHLLGAVPGEASRDIYAAAVMEENCLGKRTASTRKLSLQRLTELYGLDARIILFRVLRDLWSRHETSHPLLALLLALARDPLLRATARVVLETPVGHELARQPMKDALREVVGDRLNDATLDKVVRNASSSWTQSGHLRGRGRKTRQAVGTTPVAAAYALLLGFAAGRRGRRLFESPWAAVLDTEPDDLINSAFDAKRLGLLELKQSGSMIDISFPSLLTEQERERTYGTHRQAG